MIIPVVQISWCGKRIESIKADHVIRASPQPGYEHGRKAAGMAHYWEWTAKYQPPGVLWMDPDIVADPDDLAAMGAAVIERPTDVHTGVAKLWPASTGRLAWIWSHRGGELGRPEPTQDIDVPIAYVSTGFLFTPARLLTAAAPVMRAWQWNEVDVGLSEICLTSGIPMHLVKDARPKHVHF